jgi:hypothetical protein
LVQIEFSPWVKIIVHEVTEYPNDRLFEDILRLSLSQNIHIEPVVNWIDGIAYLIYPMPETEDVVSDKLKGIIHFSSVSFTKINYSAHYPLAIGGQEYTVSMRRADNNEILSELVKWLREPRNYSRTDGIQSVNMKIQDIIDRTGTSTLNLRR